VGQRGDEPPLARELVDDGSGLGFEMLGAVVETVEVQARLLGGVGKDVFFEVVIAELCGGVMD
jgi:hypothetical protein